MKTLQYNDKVCNTKDLHAELVSQGFSIYGVSCDGEKTYIHLKDEETKDPSIVVNNHSGTQGDNGKTEAKELKELLISRGVINQ